MVKVITSEYGDRIEVILEVIDQDGNKHRHIIGEVDSVDKAEELKGQVRKGMTLDWME